MGKETSPLNNPFIYCRRWLILLLTWLIFSQASPNLSQQQINALVDFYYATNGDSWRYFPSNTTNPWNVTNPHPNPCQEKWQGVTCSCPTNRCTVINLELNHHNLSGTLPSSLGDLSTITLFNIDNNHVGGSIPTSVKSLKALTTWVTGSNNLTGSVPEAFGSLPLLSFINMPNNLITYLPEAIYNNTNLRGLFLSNNLIYGTISPKIGNWRKIEVLSLDNNQFYSTIPVSIGNLISLTSLELSRNSLNGSLPSSIGNCNNLTRFVMNYNPITGTLPDSIGNLKNLRTLVIHYNQFFGSLPDSLGGLTKLNILDLGGNLFTGTLPSSFNNLEAMIELHLCPGTFHGPVTFIQSLRYISSLELCYNFFSGNLGALFHNNSKLLHIFELSFGVNQFTGSLPVLENSTITIYDAHKNYLSGNIPDNKHFLTHIYYFEIAENYVTGSLPQNIFESSHIVNINFSLNLFTGILPFPENTSQTINQISLGYNFLTGTISENIGLARFMVSFSVQNNGFTGTIPQGLRHCGPLQTLYLNNNHFIGSIDVLLNQSLPIALNLRNIDLSNNAFTGTLPNDFFLQESKLITFAAVSNCLKGSIPDSICQVKTLTALALDGLSSSSNCHIDLFPDISYFSSFIVSNDITGSIPTCLYSMPNLQTLHLSGNLLKGTIPSNITIASNLTDLTLSHNLMTGTIPKEIQRRQWNNLDLSYNKFTGTLSHSFSSYSNEDSVSLQVNRLSGNIPTSLLPTKSINLLNGNIFTCNDNRELPTNDPSYESYSCGSNTTNSLLYAWMSLLIILLLISLIIYRYAFISKNLEREEEEEKGKLSFWAYFLAKYRTQQLSKDVYIDENKSSNIAHVKDFFQQFKRTLCIIAMFVLLILLPVYSILSTFYHTYSNQYAWTISALLSSGDISSIGFFACFLLFISLVLFELNKLIVVHKPKEDLEASRKSVKFNPLQGNAYIIALIIVDIIVMASSDIIYVIIVLNYDTTIVLFAALALASGRLIFNNFLIKKGLALSWRIFSSIKRDIIQFYHRIIGRNDVQPSPVAAYVYSSRDIAILELLTIINNIILPIFAIFVILPDCFYNALFAFEKVQSSYSYKECAEYFSEGAYSIFCGQLTQVTAYTPPFIYSYQCSSKIVINYVPVYLILFFITGIVLPFRNVIGYIVLEYNEYYEGKNISSLVRRLASWMKHVISTPLLPLTEESEQSVHRWVLFPKLKLTTQWTSSLIIIVAIGGIFPPVAMIGCFACIVVIYEQEWIIGKLIEESQRKNQLWIIQRLEDDCKDISNSLQFSIPASLIISCFLFAYILFDTIGDTDGWKVGLIEGVIMVAVPLLLYGGYWIWTKRIVLGSLLDTTGKDIKGADGERPTVELNPMRNNDSVHITGSSLLSV